MSILLIIVIEIRCFSKKNIIDIYQYNRKLCNAKINFKMNQIAKYEMKLENPM